MSGEIDPTVELFEEAMRFSNTATSLSGVIPILRLAVDQLVKLVGKDPEIAPEIEAATEHLEAAGEALMRAMTFAVARLDTNLGIDTGDTPGDS